MTAVFINKNEALSLAYHVGRDKSEVEAWLAEQNEGMADKYEGVIVQSAEHLLETVNGGWMLAVYNELADKPTAKFADKQSGARRVWALLEKAVPVEIEPTPAVTPEQPKGKKTKAPKEPKEPKAKKAKKEAKEKKESPRSRPMWARDIPMPYRKATQSGATWELLRKNPGLSFKELSAMGARENTLADAIKHGYISFEAVSYDDGEDSTEQQPETVEQVA
jgi:hypothetical protein